MERTLDPNPSWNGRMSFTVSPSIPFHSRPCLKRGFQEDYYIASKDSVYCRKTIFSPFLLRVPIPSLKGSSGCQFIRLTHLESKAKRKQNRTTLASFHTICCASNAAKRHSRIQSFERKFKVHVTLFYQVGWNNMWSLELGITVRGVHCTICIL